MKLLRVLATMLTLALVLVVVLWESEHRTSPGPLHPAHAAVAALDGGANCEACHGDGTRQGMASACSTCHEPIGRQLADARGLHGSLDPALARDCAACHDDHHGAETRLIREAAFVLAGVPDRTRYDHAHVADWALAGAHAGLACTKCHVHAEAASPPAGGRFLGLSQSCASCHDDVHRGAFGADCTTCHGQERPFREAPGFRHEVFALTGAHASVGCTECHAEGSDRAVVSYRTRRPEPRACNACHENVHVATAAKPAASLLLADSSDCSRCHEATNWTAARMDAAAHARTGFALAGAHAAVACASCHGDAKQAPRYGKPAPTERACAACHDSPHTQAVLELTTAAPSSANACADCHVVEDSSFRAGRMTAAQHAATGFALAIPHATVACAKCHGEPSRPWASRFPGRQPADCRACHMDVHAGQFDHDPRHAQCTSCHEVDKFVPHRFDVAMHARTDFALTGSHERARCEACHDEVTNHPTLGTQVRRFHGTEQACASCHADVHAGRFDQQGLPATVGGNAGCARCHDTVQFAPAAVAFDHALWTGYPLLGAHEAVGCSGCHPRTTEPPRMHGPAKGRECASCHEDVHQGQFATRDPRTGATTTDCARCHVVEDLRALRFDHQRDSRFALDANHDKLACSSCHRSVQTERGPMIRYKPLGTNCGDCHVAVPKARKEPR